MSNDSKNLELIYEEQVTGKLQVIGHSYLASPETIARNEIRNKKAQVIGDDDKLYNAEVRLKQRIVSKHPLVKKDYLNIKWEENDTPHHINTAHGNLAVRDIRVAGREGIELVYNIAYDEEQNTHHFSKHDSHETPEKIIIFPLIDIN